MAGLPQNTLPGGAEDRIESAYADPDNACAGYVYANRTGEILIRSVEADGFCALRILRR
jgi:hypothetical protein